MKKTTIFALVITIFVSTSVLGMKDSYYKDPGPEPYHKPPRKTKHSKTFDSQPSIINPYTVTAATAAVGMAIYGGYSLYSWLFNKNSPAEKAEKDVEDECYQWMLKNFKQTKDPSKNELYSNFEKVRQEEGERYKQEKEIKKAKKKFREAIGENKNKKHQKRLNNNKDREKEWIEVDVDGGLKTKNPADEFAIEELARIIFLKKPKKRLGSEQMPSGINKIATDEGGEKDAKNGVTGSYQATEELYQKGNDLYREGRYQDAGRCFEEILNDQEKHKEWLENHYNEADLLCSSGNLLFMLNDSNNALIFFNDIYEQKEKYRSWLQDPINEADLICNIARCFYSQKKYEKAKDYFNKIYNDREKFSSWFNDPYNDAQLHFILGLSFYVLKQHEDAIKYFSVIYNNQEKYKSWLQDSINEAYLIYMIVSCPHSQEEHEKAKDYFNKIYNDGEKFSSWFNDPYDDAQLYFMSGLFFYTLKQHEDAIKCFSVIYNNQEKYESWFQPGNKNHLYYLYKNSLLITGRYAKGFSIPELDYDPYSEDPRIVYDRLDYPEIKGILFKEQYDDHKNILAIYPKNIENVDEITKHLTNKNFELPKNVALSFEGEYNSDYHNLDKDRKREFHSKFARLASILLKNNQIIKLKTEILDHRSIIETGDQPEGLSDDDLTMIARALSKNTSLKTLTLSGHLIGVQGGKEIARALEKNKSLEFLNIRSDMPTNREVTEAITDALINNHSLKGLDYDVESEGTELFLAAPCLQFLDLYTNNPDVLLKFSSALEKNSSLLEFALCIRNWTKHDDINKGLIPFSLKPLADALKKNCSLKKLNIFYENDVFVITDQEEFVEALEVNWCLEEVEFEGFDFEKEGGIKGDTKEKLDELLAINVFLRKHFPSREAEEYSIAKKEIKSYLKLKGKSFWDVNKEALFNFVHNNVMSKFSL